METIALWFANTLGQFVPAEVVVFIISLMPILEERGGLLVAWSIGVPLSKAIPICIVGNMLPVPFILLFIKKIFQWMKKHHICEKFVLKLENRAMRKSDRIEKYEFWGLLFFVGIPLPGTGAWTGCLIASLLNIDIKKATIASFFGVLLAALIMSIVSYGLLGTLFG